MATASGANPRQGEALALRLFTTDEYGEMLRVGILRSGEPVELLGGLIRKKSPKTPNIWRPRREHFTLWTGFSRLAGTRSRETPSSSPATTSPSLT